MNIRSGDTAPNLLHKRQILEELDYIIDQHVLSYAAECAIHVVYGGGLRPSDASLNSQAIKRRRLIFAADTRYRVALGKPTTSDIGFAEVVRQSQRRLRRQGNDNVPTANQGLCADTDAARMQQIDASQDMLSHRTPRRAFGVPGLEYGRLALSGGICLQEFETLEEQGKPKLFTLAQTVIEEITTITDLM